MPHLLAERHWAATDRTRQVPVRELTNLIQRLQSNYGQEEKQLASAVEDLRTYTMNVFNVSETAQAGPTQYVDWFKQVSFESQEQFQRMFPGLLAEKGNNLSEKQQKLDLCLGKLEQ